MSSRMPGVTCDPSAIEDVISRFFVFSTVLIFHPVYPKVEADMDHQASRSAPGSFCFCGRASQFRVFVEP